MSIAYLFATKQEAEFTIKALHCKQISKNQFTFDKGILVITGMGILNASRAATLLPATVKIAYNFGIVGALNDSFEYDSIYTVGKIGFNLSLPNNLSNSCNSLANLIYPTLTINNKGHSLVSSNYPIHDEAVRTKLNKLYDFVDMEGYGLASSLACRNIPLKMIKLASDLAKPSTKQDIFKNLPKYSALLSTSALSELEKTLK